MMKLILAVLLAACLVSSGLAVGGSNKRRCLTYVVGNGTNAEQTTYKCMCCTTDKNGECTPSHGNDTTKGKRIMVDAIPNGKCLDCNTKAKIDASE